MNRLYCAFLLLIGLGGSMTAETSRQPGREIVAPAGDRPARVLGQARTEAEYEAFVALKSALGPLGKAESAQDFLERFPLSGLSPFAHQVAATAYHQLNDYDSFIHHAERALLEVPHDPLLQTRLAVAYAQSHQTRKAVGQARRGLKTIETLRRPPKVSEEEWNSQLMRFRADANYALGTAYLEDFSNSGGGSTDPVLREARGYLERAILQDPRHDAAHFRLGFAYLKQNQADRAIRSYARAAALDGFTSSLARQHLEKIYRHLHPPLPDEDQERYELRIAHGLNGLVAQEREYFGSSR